MPGNSTRGTVELIENQRNMPTDHDSPFTQMQIDIAVLKEKVGGVDLKMDKLSIDLRDTYARKTDVKAVEDRVAKLQDNISWAIKLVLGLVIVAIVGIVIVKGGTR